MYHDEIRGRTETGGKIRPHRKVKRKGFFGRPPAKTIVGERKTRKIRTRGGGLKIRLVQDVTVNIVDSNTNVAKRAKILEVIENPANKQFTRRKVITKGALLLTDEGLVRVTSRPGQSGVINAVKVEE